jgi:hypothetical protein
MNRASLLSAVILGWRFRAARVSKRYPGDRTCTMRRVAVMAVWLTAFMGHALMGQAVVQYAGGTPAEFVAGSEGRIELTDDQYFAFYSKKAQLRVPYDHINLLEYGQQVSRNLAIAALISPLFLLTKSRKHFLTLGYTSDDGKQQAMVFRVGKNSIRVLLVSLEARTGLKVEYQDEDARKAGKG